MSKSVYCAKPIGSLSALSLALNINVHALQSIASRVSDLYTSFCMEKKDGSPRSISSPHRDLKFLQKRINKEIFGNVQYPSYLFGGIIDRDYVKNASVHKGAKALIALDVSNFYPSISIGHVKSIFQYFFRFPADVAEILTKICTLDGKVPQGACTSSNIANLVFHNVEPLLVDYLESKNLKYTRLLDDISISSPREFSKAEIENIVQRVTRMLADRGMKLKNKKTRIVTKSNPENLMEVTGLWLNRGRPRVKREERYDIRSELRQLTVLFGISRVGDDYHKKFNRVSGRVAKLTHLSHFEAAKYREKLRGMLPHLSVQNISHLRRQVHGLGRVKLGNRDRFEYIDKYNKVYYRVMILRRSNIAEAKRLEVDMKKFSPVKTKGDIIYG